MKSAFKPGAYASKPKDPNAPRIKGVYIGAPACFALDLECQHIWQAFCRDTGGVYVVGSCLQRSDWRDVDVRCIIDDEAFYKLFPGAAEDHWEFDSRWLVMTVSISEFLSKRTGLPIDFQFQPRLHANSRHHGMRHPTGIRLAGK